VKTPTGYRNIEDIRAGDEVLSYNEHTKRLEVQTVAQTIIRKTDRIYTLVYDVGTKLQTTATHPYRPNDPSPPTVLTDLYAVHPDGSVQVVGKTEIKKEEMYATGSVAPVYASIGKGFRYDSGPKYSENRIRAALSMRERVGYRDPFQEAPRVADPANLPSWFPNRKRSP